MKTPSRRTKHNPESPQEYDHQCVCQICTCGNHHCPKKGHTPFQGETSYHKDYVAYKIQTQTRQPTKYQVPSRHYDPDMLKSSYDQFYTPHQITTPKPEKKPEYHPSKAQFYDHTEYNDSYDRKPIPAESLNPHCVQSHYKVNKSKFNGTTTYNAEFTPKPIEPTHDYPQRTHQKRKQPFQGITTYAEEFVPRKIEQKQNETPMKHQYKSRRNRFEGESRYQADYKAHKIEPEHRCPVLDLPPIPKECSPGKTHVNYSAEKNKWV